MPSVRTFTESGGHPVNEDAFLVRTDGDRLLVALADGMGGQPGGRRAANLAVDKALDLLTDRGWIDALKRADAAVSADKEAGLTTLIGLSIQGDLVEGASCGDSAVLALDSTGRLQELTQGQRKNPPVGSGEAVFLPFAAQFVLPWTLLVMSDGVWKYAGWERIREAMKTLRGQPLIDALQDAARMKGSKTFQDDFTLIAIQDTE